METWKSIFVLLSVLALFFSGCAGGVSNHGYTRGSPFSVNESHDLDYYQMYGP